VQVLRNKSLFTTHVAPRSALTLAPFLCNSSNASCWLENYKNSIIFNCLSWHAPMKVTMQHVGHVCLQFARFKRVWELAPTFNSIWFEQNKRQLPTANCPKYSNNDHWVCAQPVEDKLKCQFRAGKSWLDN